MKRRLANSERFLAWLDIVRETARQAGGTGGAGLAGAGPGAKIAKSMTAKIAVSMENITMTAKSSARAMGTPGTPSSPYGRFMVASDPETLPPTLGTGPRRSYGRFTGRNPRPPTRASI